MRSRRRRLPSDQEIVDGITEIADDGYCSAYDLHLQPFRPDGRRYVAVAAEGWRLLQPGEQ